MGSMARVTGSILTAYMLVVVTEALVIQYAIPAVTLVTKRVTGGAFRGVVER